jgi:hypothetical protein
VNDTERRGKSKETVAIISMGVVVLGQLVGSVWWAATLSSDVRHLTVAVTAMQSSQYTRSDAERDQKYARERMGEIERRLGVVEAR